MQKDRLQQERRKLAAALEARIIDGKDRIAFADIQALNLPEVLLSSLQKQAKHIFKTEKPIRIVQSERFDFSGDKLREELTRLREVLLDGVFFLPAEIKKAIQLSLALHFDLAVLPFRTVTSILFQTTKTKSSRDCVEILNNVGEKMPPIKALSDRILVYEKDTLGKADIDKLAGEIKAEIYAVNPVSSVLFDLDYLKNIYDAIYENEKSAFASEVIHAMLIERGMDDFVAGFREEEREKKQWTLEEIQQFLERYLLVGQLQHDDSFSSHIYYSDEADDAHDAKQAADALEVEPVPENETDSQQSREKPLTETDTKKQQAEQPGRSFRSGQTFDPESTDLIDRKKIEYQPPGPYPPLTSIIDNKSRGLFIKKIFGKDKLAYVEFIDTIEKKESWKEAKSILDAELHARNINPFCREAVKLSDMIFARYFSKGKF